jgi:CRISPR type III-A-associated RAMP protein Csm5
LKVELVTLTPVHIGSGGKITPFEYLSKDGLFYRVDLERALQELSPENIQQTLLKKNTNLTDIDPEAHKKYPRYILDAEETVRGDVREHIQFEDRFYIPGSSLKGAILSSLYYHVLTTTREKQATILSCLQREKDHRKGREAHRTLQSIVFERITEKTVDSPRKERRADQRFTPWLRITDSNYLYAEDLYVSKVWAEGTDRNTAAYYELIKPETTLNIEITPQRLKQDIAARLSELTDEFYRLVAERQREQWGVVLPEAEGAVLVRLGQGSGSLATSLQLTAEKLGVTEEYLKAWNISKYRGEPKTMKLTRWQGKTVPLGWCAVRWAT